MMYERECPKCGVMLKYVVEDGFVSYWCHDCDYKTTIYVGDVKDVE